MKKLLEKVIKFFKNLFKKKNVIITRDLLYFDILNLNDRLYKIESIINLEQLKQRANDCVLYGQLGYPETFDISLSKISHMIHDIWIEDNTLKGTIEILNTNEGKELRRIGIDNFVFRPRSEGTINNDKVCENIKIITFDAVDKKTDAFKGLI